MKLVVWSHKLLGIGLLEVWVVVNMFVLVE